MRKGKGEGGRKKRNPATREKKRKKTAESGRERKEKRINIEEGEIA